MFYPDVTSDMPELFSYHLVYRLLEDGIRRRPSPASKVRCRAPPWIRLPQPGHDLITDVVIALTNQHALPDSGDTTRIRAWTRDRSAAAAPRGKEARLEGLEPPAIGLEIRCSIHLSYRRVPKGIEGERDEGIECPKPDP